MVFEKTRIYVVFGANDKSCRKSEQLGVLLLNDEGISHIDHQSLTIYERHILGKKIA